MDIQFKLRVEITSYNGWTHPLWNSNDLSGGTVDLSTLSGPPTSSFALRFIFSSSRDAPPHPTSRPRPDSKPADLALIEFLIIILPHLTSSHHHPHVRRHRPHRTPLTSTAQ